MLAEKHCDSIIQALQRLLHAPSPLTPFQRARVVLPEREGGMACVTSAQVLEVAYIGSAGAVARFYTLDCWPEAALLYGCMTRWPALRGIVDFLTARFEDTADQSTDSFIGLMLADPISSLHRR